MNAKDGTNPLEFKTGAVTRTGPQCVLNILKSIPDGIRACHQISSHSRRTA
jgi:hypothetical protein